MFFLQRPIHEMKPIFGISGIRTDASNKGSQFSAIVQLSLVSAIYDILKHQWMRKRRQHFTHLHLEHLLSTTPRTQWRKFETLAHRFLYPFYFQLKEIIYEDFFLILFFGDHICVRTIFRKNWNLWTIYTF